MNAQEPIFKAIFGDAWERLPPVMRKHYAVRPYSHDVVTAEGTMDVMCKWYLIPIFKPAGSLPALNAQGVPVTVRFTGQQGDASFGFERIFHVPNGKPIRFDSRMTRVSADGLMERMKGGVCWHIRYGYDGRNVKLTHQGYAWRIGRRYLPLPLSALLGAGHAEEWAIDEDTFEMRAALVHPLLGKIYEYQGRFRVVSEA